MKKSSMALSINIVISLITAPVSGLLTLLMQIMGGLAKGFGGDISGTVLNFLPTLLFVLAILSVLNFVLAIICLAKIKRNQDNFLKAVGLLKIAMLLLAISALIEIVIAIMFKGSWILFAYLIVALINIVCLVSIFKDIKNNRNKISD
ncbi:MAG: hypothetical protein IKM43_02725 [Clostridia bacterium]|nr:hypothetical protein [Clostridia bacterium]